MARWRPVPGFYGYEVSDEGQVRSVDRIIDYTDGRRHRHKGKVLRQHTDAQGRKNVSLTNNSTYRTIRVHRLVLLAFRGRGPKGHVCCHNNGDPSDNRLSNLRWDTPKANSADQLLHGTRPIGSQRPAAKLTEDQVRVIQHSTGTCSEVASRFGISRSTVSLIRRREIWRHVK